MINGVLEQKGGRGGVGGEKGGEISSDKIEEQRRELVMGNLHFRCCENIFKLSQCLGVAFSFR